MPVLVDAVSARMKRPPLSAPTTTTLPGGGGETASSSSAAVAAPFPHLWQLLALLYQRQGRPDLSLSILLQLRSPDAFPFIEQHALVSD